MPLKIINLGKRLLPYIIYILQRPTRRELNKEIRTILDVGCGQGLVGKYGIHHKNIFAVGVDIYEPDLRIARERGAYDDYILCDVRALPFKEKGVEAVLCTEVLEHLDKEEGEALLKDMEAIARKKVIVSTPVGYLHTDPEANRAGEESANPYQEHKGGWGADELRALDYKVYYNNYLHRLERYLAHRHRTWSWLSSIIIFSLLSPLMWLSPSLGPHLFCVKELDRPGERLN
jgi:ubiquinone/menaquinone biosynthesis C-methylase UbiE